MTKSEKLLGICVITISLIAIFKAFTGPKSVKIDSTHFSCTATDSFGIEARCTQYTYNVGAR